MLRSPLAAVLLVAVTFAGCTDESGAATGDFTLAVTDSLAGGRLEVKGVFLRGADGWVQAADNGTAFAFEGDGGNASHDGRVPTGTYDALRILFSGLQVGGRNAILAQSGLEVPVNVTVANGGRTQILLEFAWADALFESTEGLAFQPALARLVVVQDGTETLRLEAQDIRAAGQAPVARMRIFDSTGLEAFASTFVAESPEKPVVANAGELTLSGTGSEVLRPGATLTAYTWDIGGVRAEGATVRHAVPIHGGNLTVRLTVTDSDGGSDSQSVRLALKPGLQQRTFNATGTATGLLGNGAEEHEFGPILAGELDGAPARLVHVTALLEPGPSTIPVADLDFSLVDGAGTTVGSASGSGSQHRIDRDITGEPGDGLWKAIVRPQQAYEASYTVRITLTWQGVNPGIEAFLASYDDGHGHQH
jgi:hypothetical protein